MQTISFSYRLAELENTPVSSSMNSPDTPLDDMDILCDIHDKKDLYASMGFALSSLPAFHNDSLKLYCGVPAKYLLPGTDSSCNEFLDFVICRGKNAVMAMKLMELDPEHFHQESSRILASLLAAGFPSGLVEFSYYDSRQDPAWYAQNIIAFNISQCFQSDGPYVKTSLCPIPSDLLKQLSASSLRVLVKEKVGNKKYWFPTEYGRSLGILQGFRTDKNGKVHPLLCCTKEAIDDLRQTVSWGETREFNDTGEKVSFTQRIDAVNQGMTRNLSTLMDMIQRFGETPLTEYFKDHPDDLNEITCRVPGEYNNYQQLAARLAPFQNEGPLDVLIHPLITESKFPFADKPLRSVFYAASYLARNRYLTWSADKIFYVYAPHVPAKKWTYKQWLTWTVAIIKKYQGDQEKVSELYDLIYRIAVEPFSLIQQCLK